MEETKGEKEDSEINSSKNHQTVQDWHVENSKAIEEYNRSVERDSVFSDGRRGF